MTPSTADASRVLVACVGNPLVADDAVGPAVHGILSEGPLPEGVRVELLAVGGVRLLDELRGESALVVVDAVRFGAPAGTVHVLPWDRIPECGAAPVTSHGIGIRETIDIGRLLYPERVPGKVLLVGVEGRRFDDIGGGMTPEVAAAVKGAAGAVLRVIGNAGSPVRTPEGVELPIAPVKSLSPGRSGPLVRDKSFTPADLNDNEFGLAQADNARGVTGASCPLAGTFRPWENR